MLALEDYLLFKLQPKLIENKEDLPSAVRPFIPKPEAIDLQELVNAINSLPNSCNTQVRGYLLIILHLKIESFPALESNWHDFLIYIIKFLNSLPDIDAQDLIDRTCNSSLMRAIQTPIKLETLLKEYSLLSKLKPETSINIDSFLTGIETYCKTKILDSVSSIDDIENALKKLKSVTSNGINLISTKKLILTLISQHKLQIDKKKLESLKSEIKALGVEYNGELDVEEQKQEPSDGLLIKNRILYMNNTSDPEVNVWECIKAGASSRIALKELRTYNLSLLDPYKNEADILKRLSNTNNPNFLKFYNESLTTEPVGSRQVHVLRMEMEFVELTLKKHKEERWASKQGYSEGEIMKIMFQIVCGFKFLLAINILHNDIKPSNILISEENDLCIKIIDFNTSRELSYSTIAYDPTGTIDFMAPEVRLAHDSNKKVISKGDKADVFSLGLTILYLVTDAPFAGLNLEQNKSKLIELINTVKFPWLKQILHKMLDFKVNSRIGLNDLFKENPSDFSKTVIN